MTTDFSIMVGLLERLVRFFIRLFRRLGGKNRVLMGA